MHTFLKKQKTQLLDINSVFYIFALQVHVDV